MSYMPFALKIINGPKANQIVLLKQGLTIGRSAETKLSFDDPKMSGQHIEFTLTAEGWVAVDLGSKNGFRLNGTRSKKSIVVPGSYLKVGDTEFEVVNVETPPEPPTRTAKKAALTAKKTAVTEQKTAVAPRPPAVPPPRPEATVVQPPPIKPMAPKAPPAPEPTGTNLTIPPVSIELEPAPAPALVQVERIQWPEYFAQFVQLSAEKVRSKTKELLPFRRAVQLSVLKGLQSETVWTLGYGPREVGPHSVDLIIEDPGAPPICFSVFQKEDKIFFATDRPDVVLLNNNSVKTDNLKDGDLISFASTTIKFSFIE